MAMLVQVVESPSTGKSICERPRQRGAVGTKIIIYRGPVKRVGIGKASESQPSAETAAGDMVRDSAEGRSRSVKGRLFSPLLLLSMFVERSDSQAPGLTTHSGRSQEP